MTYWVGCAVWCGLFGVLVLVGAWRYATRGTWQRRGVARVLRVWEADQAKGWGNGVPAEVSFVDPVTGEERVGTTHGGGGRCGLLGAAWPGREVTVWVRTRRPDIFRVAAEPATFVLRHGLLGIPAVALPVFPLFRLVLGADGDVGVEALFLLSLGTVWTAVTFVVFAGELRETRRRARALRTEPVRTTGRVIATREAWRPEEDRGHVGNDTPVVAFTTLDRREVTAVCELTLRTNVERVGGEVPLLYAASCPEYVVVDRHPRAVSDGTALWAAVIAALLVSAAALTAGICMT
ncbi:DUF3592 domain-containing protein [Streptomyces sp. V4-01]|uniref:DUF3592 domain-containing protein n=1 Tax=Actinacidiphila polyblastidii TaxID=3110430 RepID=A0ABU7PFX9_9ACTN|nr:DUF3592 domain-containing protein [Streptomyces sp. V4-01]